MNSEACALAFEAMQWFGDSRSRANDCVIDENAIESFIINDSRSSECDTLFQIINFQDSAGYAIVGNVDGRKQLLAAVKGAHLSLSDDNLSVQDAILLETAKRYVVTRPRDTLGIDRPGLDIKYRTKSVIDTLFKQCVEPRIGLHWGQNGMYGTECYNFIAGCTPVAIGQMMAYFRPSGRLYYTYPGAQLPYEDLNWSAINMHKGAGIRETTCPDGVHETIPRLLREIGQRCKADYLNKGTKVGSNDIRPALSNLLPNCTNSAISNFTVTSVKDAIVDGGIVLVFGEFETGSPDDLPHTWLAEGVRFFKLRYRFMRTPADEYPAWGSEEKWEVVEERIYNECYIYYNMGFEGKGDRYVLSDLDNQIMHNSGTYNGVSFSFTGYNMNYIKVKRQ